MEFWGVEVKPGQIITCDPGVDKYLHLSQASLGESKKDKGSTSIPVYVNVDDKKLVLGTLSHDKCAQIQYDLVFEKEFKLSHGWKDGSVFFVGYKTLTTEETSDGYSDTESEDEEPHAIEKANGKPAAKEEPKVAPKPSLQKQQKVAVEVAKLKVDESDDEDESDESDEEESGDEDESDEEMGDESGEEENESSEEEEEKVTPKKPESGKKRHLDSDSKASIPDKKAKLVTPAKTEGKRGGYVATPHPAKQAAKTSAIEDKSKHQTPKSGGAFSCKSCNKSFNSENGLQSHTKAKHSGK